MHQLLATLDLQKPIYIRVNGLLWESRNLKWKRKRYIFNFGFYCFKKRFFFQHKITDRIWVTFLHVFKDVIITFPMLCQAFWLSSIQSWRLVCRSVLFRLSQGQGSPPLEMPYLTLSRQTKTYRGKSLQGTKPDIG